MTSQEVSVVLHHSEELDSGRLLKIDESGVLASCQKEVNVFHSGRVLDFACHFAVYKAPLEVKDVPQIVRVLQLKGVLHQHQVDGAG